MSRYWSRCHFNISKYSEKRKPNGTPPYIERLLFHQKAFGILWPSVIGFSLSLLSLHDWVPIIMIKHRWKVISIEILLKVTICISLSAVYSKFDWMDRTLIQTLVPIQFDIKENTIRHKVQRNLTKLYDKILASHDLIL